MEPSHLDMAPMMVDDDEDEEEEDDMLPAASSLAPATTLLREQALGLLSDAQTAERKDKEILLKQVREKGRRGG
jgi:3,4-dihydroxy-2-butanone 4-phosphate synthase